MFGLNCIIPMCFDEAAAIKAAEMRKNMLYIARTFIQASMRPRHGCRGFMRQRRRADRTSEPNLFVPASISMSDNTEPLAVPHEVVAALSRGRGGDQRWLTSPLVSANRMPQCW
jgi:hypothetical protein